MDVGLTPANVRVWPCRLAARNHDAFAGVNVAHSRTNYVLRFGRSFLENHSDPKPVAETIRKFTKVYLYEVGGLGTPIAEFLTGKAPLGRIFPPPPTVFHEGSGKVMNTIPPNDFSFYEMLNEVVQQEPATALDPELMGPIAAIGVVKGKEFAPDARMKKILTEALSPMRARAPCSCIRAIRAGSIIPAQLGSIRCSFRAMSSRPRSR